MLVYCDSVVLIYFFDHTGRFNVRATNRMAAFAAAKDRIAISHLVRLEYRIAPLRNNDAVKLAIFDAFCVQPDVQFYRSATRSSSERPRSARPSISSLATRCISPLPSKEAAIGS